MSLSGIRPTNQCATIDGNYYTATTHTLTRTVCQVVVLTKNTNSHILSFSTKTLDL